MKEIQDRENEIYKKSWRGRTSNSLYHYFLKIAIPLIFIIAILEEANPKCPRYGIWKGKLNIPSMTDFMMVEIMQINQNQDRSKDGPKDEPEDAVAEVDPNSNDTAPVVFEESKRDMDLKVQRPDYWRALFPIVYDDKDMAARVDFKTFMKRHVRKMLPAHYKNILEGDAILDVKDIG